MTGRSHLRGACSMGIAALALAGCGGSRQDAHEPNATFKVSVPAATFPAEQHIAQQALMSITVRNEDNRTIPNVAVSVNSFTYSDQQVGLADPRRPIWVVDASPSGGTTAYVNTWALGALGPGQTQTFKWRVTAVRPGHYSVAYRVGAGLNGRSKAELAAGGSPEGKFNVLVTGVPPAARVDPTTGKVVAGPPATAPGPKRK